MSGLIYLANSAVVLGVHIPAVCHPHAAQHPTSLELPMLTFRYSINYLGILFAALLIDHYFLFQLNL